MADFRGPLAPQAPNARPLPGAIPQQHHVPPQQFIPRPPQLIVIDKKPVYVGCTYTRFLNSPKKSWKTATQTIWSLSQDAMQKASKKKGNGAKDVTSGEAALKRLPGEAQKRIEDWLAEKEDLETEDRFYVWTIASIKSAKVAPLIGTGKETVDVILKRVVRPEVKDAAARTSSSPKVRRSNSLGDMRRTSFDRPPLHHHPATGMPGPRPAAHGVPPPMGGPQERFIHPHPQGVPQGQFVPPGGRIPVPPVHQPPSPGRYSTDDNGFDDDEDDDFAATGGQAPRSGPQGPIRGPPGCPPGFPPGAPAGPFQGQQPVPGMQGGPRPAGQVPFQQMRMPLPPGRSMPAGGMNPAMSMYPQQGNMNGRPMQQPGGGAPGVQQGRPPPIVHLNPGRDEKGGKHPRPDVHNVFTSSDDESAIAWTDDNASSRTSVTPSSLGEEVPFRRKSQHRHSSSHGKNRAPDAGPFRQHNRRESQGGGRRRESGDDAEYVIVNKSSRHRPSHYNRKMGPGNRYMSGAVRRNSFDDNVLPKLSRNNLRKELREDQQRQEEILNAEREMASLKENLHNMEMQDRERQIEELQRKFQRQRDQFKAAEFERRERLIAEERSERLRLEDKEMARERDRSHRRSNYDRSPEGDLAFREHGRRRPYDDEMGSRSDMMYRHDDGRRYDRMRQGRGPSRDYEGDRFGSLGARRDLRGYGNPYYD